jgi:hypothetical protein
LTCETASFCSAGAKTIPACTLWIFVGAVREPPVFLRAYGTTSFQDKRGKKDVKDQQDIRVSRGKDYAAAPIHFPGKQAHCLPMKKAASP